MIGFELYTLVVLAEGLGILVEELHDLPVQRRLENAIAFLGIHDRETADTFHHWLVLWGQTFAAIASEQFVHLCIAHGVAHDGIGAPYR